MPRKSTGEERFSFKKNGECFSGQQFPELSSTMEILTDEPLQDTIRYVLILERPTGGGGSPRPQQLLELERPQGKDINLWAA